jgi:hypothetical protein
MAVAVPIALMATAGVLKAKAARDQGKAEAEQAMIQERAEGDAARGREIERRRALMAALASQAAAAGAAGISTTEGSLQAIALRDIKDNRNDLLYDAGSTAARQRALRAKASNSIKQGNIAAFTSLLDAASGSFELMGK